VLLTKGFEVEMYTGTAAGEVVGLSDRICQALPGFVREPDRRNVEYITPPLSAATKTCSALCCDLPCSWGNFCAVLALTPFCQGAR
jgi:predicted glutamate--cysteine ligase